jgi:DNA polymerase-3 subunit delta
MKERAKIIGKTIVEDINDPFNAITIAAKKLIDDPAILNDEAHAISMMGGNRLIIIENAGDEIKTVIEDYLNNPSTDNLVILEADNLGARSSLRRLAETAKNAAALPCYVEDAKDLSAKIYKMLQEENFTIETDALNFLAYSLSGDHQKAINGTEKLITYMGKPGQKITIKDVQLCLGETGELSLDNLVYSVASHQPTKSLAIYNQLLMEGVQTVAILRALQNHFRKLHYAKSLIRSGDTTDQAMKKLTPPIFFKQQKQFSTQIIKWDTKTLERTLSKLANLESQCKQTGVPTETLCGQALLSISKK